MNKGKMLLVTIVAACLTTLGVGTVVAQDDPVQAGPSMQAQGSGRVQEIGQAPPRKGYPGIRLKKQDEPKKITEEQKREVSKIAQLIDEERQQLKAVGMDRSLSIPQKKEKIQQIRTATQDKIKALYPPEVQKKYEASLEKMRKDQDALRVKLAERSQRAQRPQ